MSFFDFLSKPLPGPFGSIMQTLNPGASTGVFQGGSPLAMLFGGGDPLGQMLMKQQGKKPSQAWFMPGLQSFGMPNNKIGYGGG